MFSRGYCWDSLSVLGLSDEKESKTIEKGRLDSLLLLICRVDTPVCHFLNCLVNYTQALKSSKLEVLNMLV